MSLEQRVIEPLYICRNTLPINRECKNFNTNDLDYIANGSMVNIIRQLSSLALHAEDILGQIINEFYRLTKKSQFLQTRMNKLSSIVNKLDFKNENLNEVNLQSNFKLNFSYDQEILSRKTMPNFLMKKYLLCDKPPPLDKLNIFRNDGKDALKFYTDPNYFFDLWKNEMLKKKEKEKFGKKVNSNKNLFTTKQIEESHGNKQIKKPREPENTTEKYRRMMSQQEFFADTIYQENQKNSLNENSFTYGVVEIQYKNHENQNNKVPDVLNSSSSFLENDENNKKDFTKIISKPLKSHPIPLFSKNELNSMIKNNKNESQLINDVQSNFQIVPPPPLPPPTINNNNYNENGNDLKISSSCNTSNFAQKIIKKQQELKPININMNPKLIYKDSHSELLASIREGIKLRSVQRHKQKQVDEKAPLEDVASVIARRIAMKLSDSESNHSVNNSENDWEDDN